MKEERYNEWMEKEEEGWRVYIRWCKIWIGNGLKYNMHDDT